MRHAAASHCTDLSCSAVSLECGPLEPLASVARKWRSPWDRPQPLKMASCRVSNLGTRPRDPRWCPP